MILYDAACPYCGRRPCQPVRWHDQGTEYQCGSPACGQTHTRKDGDPDAFAFHPGDIEAALQPSDVPPLFT